ncbi:MAG: internalin related protein [Sporomusa sp.]|nr:internalin related protein [Sporomusa sp.]
MEEIPLAPNLEELYFGDKIWNKYILDSVSPLTRAEKLKTLVFSAKKINDNDITPLAKIMNLERLEFTSNLFLTEQIAWLTANTTNINSSILAPYKKLKNPLKIKEKTKDILVIGKRKPFLNSHEDKVRLEKYESAFNDLVNKYRGSEWS